MSWKDIKAKYEAGDITAAEAMRYLTSDLGEIDDAFERAKQAKDEVRGIIDFIIGHAGPMEVGGYKMLITAPTSGWKYDEKQLDALAARLDASGMGDIARQILG